MSAPSIEVRGIPWPEIGAGDDLVALLAEVPDLRDGDVVVVTSKVVSKAEGRVRTGDRDALIVEESRRVLARRGETVIAQTRHGLVLAAAGVDASNTPPGTALPLPMDPDDAARRLRDGVLAATGANVGVVISDTAGRAWRLGQTDLAVGCAGLDPAIDLHGTLDTHGNVLVVTRTAVADEVAAAADLVKGKTSGRPIAVVRGLASSVLPPGDHGPGAAALVRPAAEDMFGLGSREAAVAAALRTDEEALRHFPSWSPADGDPFADLLTGWWATIDRTLSRDTCPQVADARATWTLRVTGQRVPEASALIAVGRLLERGDVIAAAHGLARHEHPPTPSDPPGLLCCVCWVAAL